MNLKQQLIQKTLTEAGRMIATIDAHAGLIAECETLAETLQAAGLDCTPVFSSGSSDHAVTWVQNSYGRPSDVRAAIAKAGLIIASDEIAASPTFPHAVKITLAGLTTSILIPSPAAELAQAA